MYRSQHDEVPRERHTSQYVTTVEAPGGKYRSQHDEVPRERHTSQYVTTVEALEGK
jgi:ribosomal protein S30